MHAIQVNLSSLIDCRQSFSGFWSNRLFSFAEGCLAGVSEGLCDTDDP